MHGKTVNDDWAQKGILADSIEQVLNIVTPTQSVTIHKKRGAD